MAQHKSKAGVKTLASDMRPFCFHQGVEVFDELLPLHPQGKLKALLSEFL